MFTYPLALIALAALPALAAIYILRNRFRRRQVSSLMLWRFHVQSKEGGSKVHRLQLPLLFFLELLALFLLVAAATGPHWKLPQSQLPLILVLDDSFSMRAMNEGRSAQMRAREFLEKFFRQPPPSTRVLLAGGEPRLLGSPVKSWAELESLLGQWQCWSPAAAIDASITLASEIGKQQANILVLTDQPPPDGKITGERLQWRAFGSKLPNVAIANASRTVHGDEDRCLLEIANYSTNSTTTKLLVETGTNALRTTTLALSPGERQRLVFNLPSAAPMLKASLGNDALAEDNEVLLLPPIRKRVRVQVSLTNDALSQLVTRTLDATGLRAAISSQPELVIHSTDTIPAGSNTWSLRWIADAGATAFTGPFVMDNAHPLTEGLQLAGAVWAAAATLTNPPSYVPLVMAGNVPLLAAREDALGRRQLTLNLNPELSTIQNTPDWPILFWNILQWRAAQSPGLQQSNVRLGAEVILRTTGEAVSVKWPDGTVRDFPQPGDRLSLEAPLPGLYAVTMGAATNSFAVNALVAGESDLSSCTSGEWGKWQDPTEKRYEDRSLAWLLGLMALAIMAVHLCLLSTKKVVA